VNDIVDSPASAVPDGATEPGPDDLRWAEEMFEEWQRLLGNVPRPAAISGSSGTQFPQREERR
jgi:hypothetical protein